MTKENCATHAWPTIPLTSRADAKMAESSIRHCKSTWVFSLIFSVVLFISWRSEAEPTRLLTRKVLIPQFSGPTVQTDGWSLVGLLTGCSNLQDVFVRSGWGILGSHCWGTSLGALLSGSQNPQSGKSVQRILRPDKWRHFPGQHILA